ncbi:hypothetical protein HUG10_00020 [Halorarum halophilum]|uniref:Metalloenzyme domain-containing protein n=1 Tax=Halorarum halophilum TaxID=2743090 RepID=A0A7D5G9N9_9EURY|nr:hypothetical protein [Halobaculum halophilum]QLG26026.1 hypothetical protein HUG10_00020 [Halobaculum halophilum]
MRGKDRRILLLLLDGAADRTAPALDGRTPLEAADTPNLDRLTAAGINGQMDVSAPGTPLSSDRAHTILFGYDLAEVPGRGVLEARGFGRDPKPGSVVCSASFAELDGPTIVDRHLPGDAADFPALAEREGVARVETTEATVSFEYTWKNRGLVTVESPNTLSPDVTDVDPFATGFPVLAAEPLADAADPDAAERTASALRTYTRRTREVLADAGEPLGRTEKSPADVVLSKWAGAPTKPEPFRERHGLDAASLTPKPVLTGLARTLGITHEDPPEGYDARADAALAAVEANEFVHVHYPEPDEVSHAAGPAAKRDELEAIDASLEPVVERALADPKLVTVVTADHTTPSTEDVVHSGEPVPLTVAAESVRTDDVTATGERPAAGGGLGRVRGRDFLRIARSAADRVLLDGLRRSPRVPDYPTREVRPLWPEE